jgi:hypothetical protein
MNRLALACLLVLCFCACSPVSGDTPVTSAPGGDNPAPSNPYAPRVGDDALLRSEVTLDSAEVLVMESYPVQISLHLIGNLPDPCHDLRIVVQTPNQNSEIEVTLYSLADPMTICAAMLEPFDVNLPLGSFPTGSYTVLVNGEPVGQFDS